MSGKELQRVGVTDMSKTPFSNKCLILGTLWLNYREDAASNEAWSLFFSYNDIGLPMSYMIAEGFVNLNEESAGEEIIEETWQGFCEYINIDPDAEYNDIAAAFDASPNPALEDVEESEEEDGE